MMTPLKIKYTDPHQLKKRARNARTHTPKQIKQIGYSIRQFGFVSPVLIDGSNRIVAGHARVEAAKQLGMNDIPTVRIDHLSPAQVRAYVIADNRLAELAGWDKSLLAIELKELSVELNFDVTVTGFETGQVDIIIGDAEATAEEEDPIPEIDRTKPAVSRAGDLWKLGNHYLLCGDALRPESYQALLGSKKAQMVFTDPPFNVRIVGNVTRRKTSKHREFAMASGELTPDQFTDFLTTVFQRLAEFSTDGSMHFVCMDWRHVRELSTAAEGVYSEFKNICV